MPNQQRAVKVGRRIVGVSNPGKVLYPGDGITKGDLVEYYRQVAGRMLPHLRGRPVAMERYPDGIDGERIFQKDVPGHFPGWIDRAKVHKQGGTLQQVVCEQAATLVYLANQACVTPHVFLSRTDRLDHPDQLIFDLDPAGDDFGAARRAALALRSLLEELELPSFPKTTGGKGVHVTVPLDRRADFDTVRRFARDVAAVLAARHPDRLTTEQRKRDRKGRLYLDVMRNAYAQTAVPPYAVRARPGATVATPLDWSELEEPSLRPSAFTIGSVLPRFEETDPWKDLRRRGRSLSRARRRLDALADDGGERLSRRGRAGRGSPGGARR
jgi:bifunctional non-homologous end joining protein LigD